MDTDYSLIIQNITKHIPLSLEEEGIFLDKLREKKGQKGEFLLHEQEIALYSIFVVKGCLRGYTIDVNGFAHILQFAPPDWWITDMYSLIAQKPGQLNIDAIMDSELLLLSRKDQEQLYAQVPKFERFFRIITENSLVNSRQRLLDNIALTAQQRFAAFCEQYPNLVEQLPQKQVAAYIGVTPEFLSKVKTDYFRHLGKT